MSSEGTTSESKSLRIITGPRIVHDRPKFIARPGGRGRKLMREYEAPTFEIVGSLRETTQLNEGRGRDRNRWHHS